MLHHRTDLRDSGQTASGASMVVILCVACRFMRYLRRARPVISAAKPDGEAEVDEDGSGNQEGKHHQLHQCSRCDEQDAGGVHAQRQPFAHNQ